MNINPKTFLHSKIIELCGFVPNFFINQYVEKEELFFLYHFYSGIDPLYIFEINNFNKEITSICQKKRSIIIYYLFNLHNITNEEFLYQYNKWKKKII